MLLKNEVKHIIFCKSILNKPVICSIMFIQYMQSQSILLWSMFLKYSNILFIAEKCDKFRPIWTRVLDWRLDKLNNSHERREGRTSKEYMLRLIDWLIDIFAMTHRLDFFLLGILGNTSYLLKTQTVSLDWILGIYTVFINLGFVFFLLLVILYFTKKIIANSNFRNHNLFTFYNVDFPA